MGKRAKWIGLAVLVALGLLLVACGAVDDGAGPAEVVVVGGVLRAASVPSETIRLVWEGCGEATYTGLVTDAPPAPPTLRLAVELAQDGEVIYSEARLTGLEAPTISGTGQYNGDFVFEFPEFYGPAEEWVGCWWEGEGWDTFGCLPGDAQVDERGYMLVNVLESRPTWQLYLPVFRFGAGGG